MRTEIVRERAGRGRKDDPDLTDRLMSAMLAEVAATGFEGARLEAIVAAAGTSKQAIYRRWTGKTAFADEALTWALERIDIPPPDRRSAAQDLFRLIQAYQEAFKGDLASAFLSLRGMSAFGAAVRAHEERIRFHVRQCLIATPFEQDLEVRASLISALIQQQLDGQYAGSGGLGEADLETAIYLILGLVAPRAPARPAALPGL